jgi:excisionase family DNA binding protein
MSTACAPARSEYLSPEEAAAYIGVKVQTLANWRSTGRYSVPFRRAGRLIRHRRADLDLWLDSRADGSVSGAE